MNKQATAILSFEDSLTVLGLGVGASEAQIRAAYLEQVRKHPPDRDPEFFEQIRDAYDRLRDPMFRARQVLDGPDPRAPLADLFAGMKPPRRFVGPAPWLEVLKEKRSSGQ